MIISKGEKVSENDYIVHASRYAGGKMQKPRSAGLLLSRTNG